MKVDINKLTTNIGYNDHTSPSENQSNPLTGSLASFAAPRGKWLSGRFAPIKSWIDARRRIGVWPYSRVTHGAKLRVEAADEYGNNSKSRINFGMQDYLGLSRHPNILSAAKAAIDKYGVHSGGSPIVTGRTDHLLMLEQRIAGVLGKESSVVYPTGWAAGFGVLAALVQPDDLLLLDELSHSCLKTGARYASRRCRQFEHNDLDMLEQFLREGRESNDSGGIFIVVESLYSMDSDSPDLLSLLRLAECYEAVLIIDVAHDFGSSGEQGLGLVGEVARSSEQLVIMGSFSKTFAANGGFVATSAAVRDQLVVMSPSYTFSNCISPVQTAVIDACFDIVFSDQGACLRGKLLENVNYLRSNFASIGMNVYGTPSPIVSVFVGGEPFARLMSKHLGDLGLIANLAEFPGVAPGKARFRFQLSSEHSCEDMRTAAAIMAQSRMLAEYELASQA